ncbi:MAG TPA: hypothetical protein VIV60_32370, partial [Polyangiaceae bacterium]
MALTAHSVPWAAAPDRRMCRCRQLVIIGLSFVSANPSNAAPMDGKAMGRATPTTIPAYIDVHRDPGSELCPDTEAVFQSIAALYPERSFSRVMAPSAATASILIRIRPTADGHEALLKVGLPRAGER